MKKSLHIALAAHFGSPIPAEQWQGGKPTLAINDACTHYYAKGDEAAIEQEFDGYHGYLYSYEMELYDTVSIPIRIALADLHVIYVMEGSHDLQLLDAYGEGICTIAPHRARYLYLPPANYQLHLVPGKYLIFGFYFDGGIFRQGNERPFEFIKPLLQAYRERAAVPHHSTDFKVGSDIAYRINHLCRHLRKGDLDNEYFILQALSGLIKLSWETIFEEYEQMSAEQMLATKAHDLVIDQVHRHGQEFRVAEVARILDRHVDYINRLHRRYYSLSLSEQKYETLIELAREQLRSQPAISTAAYACGYNSPAAFARFFRRHTGLSPTEFLYQERCI